MGRERCQEGNCECPLRCVWLLLSGSDQNLPLHAIRCPSWHDQTDDKLIQSRYSQSDFFVLSVFSWSIKMPTIFSAATFNSSLPFTKLAGSKRRN